MVLIPKPMSEIPKNLKNWTVISGFLFWKVQILFKKKLDVAAMVNPIAFAMYFWILIISLHRYVTPKSIIMPEAPTIPNLINLKISVFELIIYKSVKNKLNSA